MDMPKDRPMDDDYLGLDDHTISELEIFESKDGASLFQFCNLTRTKGGESVLMQRMRRPWADADRIRETQRSIAFIMENRQSFEQFDGGNLGFVTGNIEAYRHAALPVIVQNNFVEFTYGVMWLYASDAYHVSKISRGVVLMRKLLQTLRNFLAQPELASVAGELAPLLKKTRALLDSGPLSAVSDEKPGMGLKKLWLLLRHDQLFRVLEADMISRLLSLVYEIDALVAMADCTRRHKFILPAVEEGPLSIYAEGLVHPYVRNAVANPVELDQQHRGLFLTGPNMAGKTTYLRAFATGLYLAHLGMGVPASLFRFVPIQQLISSISISDNLHSGVSYFRAEALRVKDVADAIMAGDRVVAIMDEPFKGTNVKDTLEASLEILIRFSAMSNLLFMFSSHQIELAEQLQGPIAFRYFSAVESGEKLSFDYRLRAGVATQRIGMRVLREEGVFHVLDG